MKFPGAPYDLKMACGENPKRVYGEKGGPQTRMGDVAGYRAAFAKAEAYRAGWRKYWKTKAGDPPDRDIGLETLALVLDKKIPVQMHCYRGDQMATMIDVTKEFGFRIAAFHHAAEAYKIADLLKKNDICAVMWADWWGFKMEAYDGIPENIAMVDHAGACATIHSDDPHRHPAPQPGSRQGDGRGPAHGLSDHARACGRMDDAQSGEGARHPRQDRHARERQDGRCGACGIGDPFSVYAHAEKVFIDGALLYDRDNPALSPRSDFELGQEDNGHTGGAGQ